MDLLRRLDLAGTVALASRAAIVAVAIVAALGAPAEPAAPGPHCGSRHAALRPLRIEFEQLRVTVATVRVIAAAIPAVRAACDAAPRFEAASLRMLAPAVVSPALW